MIGVFVWRRGHTYDYYRPMSCVYVCILCHSGGASSGKSTFIKQLRICHGDGFPVQERAKLRSHVFENVTDGFNGILDNMAILGVEVEVPENRVSLLSDRNSQMSHRRIAPSLVLWCRSAKPKEAKRQYLLTLQVSRYCLLALQNSVVWSGLFSFFGAGTVNALFFSKWR